MEMALELSRTQFSAGQRHGLKHALISKRRPLIGFSTARWPRLCRRNRFLRG